MYPLAREWRVWPPRVFRYLEQVFIDEFFESGRVRLKSFSKFGEHTDELRRDPNEGLATFQAEGQQTEGQPPGFVQGSYGVGLRSYVMSTSLVEEEPSLSELYDGCFRIDNTFRFAAAVATALPHFRGGLEGPCIYTDERFFTPPPGGFSLQELEGLTEEEMKVKSREIMRRFASGVAFFLKLREHARQAEYRLIWHSNSDVEDYIDIECPEAREFCTKIT
jgi:hypothetical protein